jgi:hypothetical protein
MPLTCASGIRYYRRHGPSGPVFHSSEVSDMTWEAPDFVEVKMDAEINSYQDDFDREQDDRF